MTLPMQLDPSVKHNRLAMEPPAPERLSEDELGWLSALRAIRRRGRLIALVVLGLCLLALPFILAVEKTYYAETRVMISKTAATALAESATIRTGETDVSTEVERLGSSENAEAVIARFDLAAREEFNPDLEAKSWPARLIGWLLPPRAAGSDPAAKAETDAQVLAKYRGALLIRQQGRSNVVTIGFTSRDRQLAAAVPAAVVEAYRAQSATRWQGGIAEAAAWLDDRIETARQHVTDSRAALDVAGKENGDASAETVAAALNGLNALETRGVRLVQELADLRTTLASIVAAEDNIALSALSEPEALGNLRRELQEQARELENVALTFGENSDVVVRGRARAEAIRDDIRAELAAYRNGLELREKVLTVEAGDVDRRAALAREQLARQQRAAQEQDRRAQVLREQEQALSQLEYRHQSLLAEGQLTPVALDVLSPAAVPRFPLGPGRKAYLVAVAFGSLLIALTLAGAVEVFDKSVRSHEQLTHLRQLTPVGYLPVPAAGSAAAPVWPPAREFGECLSRAVLMMETANHGEFPASVLVFPADGREDSGQTARWLALDLVAAGQKVLLVEVCEGSATAPRGGRDRLSITQIERGRADGIDRLRLDARLAHGERFQAQLTALLTDAACAGFVTIIDGPPLDRLITLKIAQLVECRLVVLRWGRSARSTAELVAVLTAKAGLPPVSSLIVDVKPSQHSKYGFTDLITLMARGRRPDAV